MRTQKEEWRGVERRASLCGGGAGEMAGTFGHRIESRRWVVHRRKEPIDHAMFCITAMLRLFRAVTYTAPTHHSIFVYLLSLPLSLSPSLSLEGPWRFPQE